MIFQDHKSLLRSLLSLLSLLLEAILERPFLNVMIQPNAWESGKGQQAMRAMINSGLRRGQKSAWPAGLAGRFKKMGFRKPKVQEVEAVVEVEDRSALRS